MNDEIERRSWWSRLPSWGRIGLIAGVVIVLTLAGIVGFRLLTRVPSIPLGSTAADALIPGSCVAEAGDLDRYTVVGCGEPHPQQIFAEASLDLDDFVYAGASGALQQFADEVCSRYLEYRLFLVADLDKNEYTVVGIDVPTPPEYEAGDTAALCAISSNAGEPLDRDLYRPMP